MLHFINFYILQWFFLRLAKEYRRCILSIDPYEVSVTPEGAGVGFKVNKEQMEKRWVLIAGAYPMSGYDDYKGDKRVKERPWKYTSWQKDIVLSKWK